MFFLSSFFVSAFFGHVHLMINKLMKKKKYIYINIYIYMYMRTLKKFLNPALFV